MRHKKTHEFGRLVRQFRHRAGMTLTEAAEAMGYTYSTISRLELGVIGPTEESIEGVVRAFSLTAEQEQELRFLASKKGLEIENIVTSPGMLPLWQRVVKAREWNATLIRQYNGSVISGFLQTPRYMEQLFVALGETKKIKQACEERLSRQEILKDKNRRFLIVLDESALKLRFTTLDIHIEQLEHLIDVVGKYDNVDVRILPSSTRLAAIAPTPFDILDDTCAVVETLTHEFVIDRELDVKCYIEAFGELRAVSLAGFQAREFVSSVVEQSRAA